MSSPSAGSPQGGSPRVRFVTFGCKANQYDTQVLREALGRRGYRETDGESELVVINTCTVTAEAGRKARQLARRIARETPEARICMTGCLAESEPEVLRALPNVEWVLGNGEAKRPLSFLREIGADVAPEELGIPAGITEFAGHTRGFLKIQDGCDHACAFCIIPSVRGKSRSRPAAELGAEVRRLLASGHREIVLCGIHIGHWGRDLTPRRTLGELVAELAQISVADQAGRAIDWRLRLSSIEATEVDDSLLDAMAGWPRRVAPHLHMPLQSGDDGVLAAMNRWYGAEEYLAACDRIRAALDRPAFTADVLVGFPGEDAAAFENTVGVVRAAGFTRVHVFPFSPRPGTGAAEPARIGRPVRPEEVRERRAELGEVAAEEALRFRRALDGARDSVVLEGGAGLSGRYQRVAVDLDALSGLPDLVDVLLEARTEADGGVSLHGTPWEAAGAAGHVRSEGDVGSEAVQGASR